MGPVGRKSRLPVGLSIKAQIRMDNPGGFCGTRDTFRGPQCKWPQKPTIVTYRLEFALPGLTTQQLTQGFLEGIVPWQEEANIILEARASGSVNLRVIDVKMDGPHGVLADCQLPCGLPSDFQLIMRFDNTDVWPYDKYVKVARHEFGHGLGLGHANARGNIMFPSLDMNVARLGPDDIAEIAARYGKRTTPIPPPPPPPPKPPVPRRTPNGLPMVMEGATLIPQIDGSSVRHQLRCSGSVERAPGGVGALHPGVAGKVGARGPWGELRLKDRDGYEWHYWLAPE